MEAKELKFLLDHIQSQLGQAKTNKQKLVLIRDRWENNPGASVEAKLDLRP